MQAPKGKVIKSLKISKTSIPTHLKGFENSLEHMFMKCVNIGIQYTKPQSSHQRNFTLLNATKWS